MNYTSELRAHELEIKDVPHLCLVQSWIRIDWKVQFFIEMYWMFMIFSREILAACHNILNELLIGNKFVKQNLFYSGQGFVTICSLQPTVIKVII
jgi:hypothetical protein